MDLTGWLEYFVDGLTTQLTEVRHRGAQAIQRDSLVRRHNLNPRQAASLDYIIEHGSLNHPGLRGPLPGRHPAYFAAGSARPGGQTHRLGKGLQCEDPARLYSISNNIRRASSYRRFTVAFLKPRKASCRTTCRHDTKMGERTFSIVSFNRRQGGIPGMQQLPFGYKQI